MMRDLMVCNDAWLDGMQWCMIWWYEMMRDLMVWNDAWLDGMKWCVTWWYAMMRDLMVWNDAWLDGMQWCVTWWYAMIRDLMVCNDAWLDGVQWCVTWWCAPMWNELLFRRIWNCQEEKLYQVSLETSCSTASGRMTVRAPRLKIKLLRRVFCIRNKGKVSKKHAKSIKHTLTLFVIYQ